ncbi:MAG TPA: hypothetical protein GXZ59_05160 [Clostridiaceae bacterium]|nr:hypothetical protein [Clostridiaceae bacterium]
MGKKHHLSMNMKKPGNFRSLRQKSAVNNTTSEDYFINECIHLLTPVELKLTNGESYLAVITAHDRKSIIIKECPGCQTLVYKNALSYIKSQLSRDFIYAEDSLDESLLKRGSKYAPYYS